MTEATPRRKLPPRTRWLLLVGAIVVLSVTYLRVTAFTTDAAFWESHDFVGMTVAEVIRIAGPPTDGWPNTLEYCLDHGEQMACAGPIGQRLKIFLSADVSELETIEVKAPDEEELPETAELFTSAAWLRPGGDERSRLIGDLVRSGNLEGLGRKEMLELLGRPCAMSLTLHYTYMTGFTSFVFVNLVLDEEGIVVRPMSAVFGTDQQ